MKMYLRFSSILFVSAVILSVLSGVPFSPQDQLWVCLIIVGLTAWKALLYYSTRKNLIIPIGAVIVFVILLQWGGSSIWSVMRLK